MEQAVRVVTGEEASHVEWGLLACVASYSSDVLY
jgi:hypothetical protein